MSVDPTVEDGAAPIAEPQAAAGPRLPYLPGIDGLRAIAVIAVMLYHADILWVPGGFLGVEVFFVISGYLITGLLSAEWRNSGHIDLAHFWLRRARRLLPAVFALLIGALAFAVVFLPDEVASLRGDALAAAFYVSNWWQVFSHKSYFEAIGRLSLLRHLWSLAVEEQFYLVWPLLLAAGLRYLRPRRALVGVVLAGAAASILLMAAMYQPDIDPSRIYYGTDTRAAGFLIGAALAMLAAPGGAACLNGRVVGRSLDLLGPSALIGLVVCFVALDEINPFLYQGGFATVALLTAIAITASTHTEARVLPVLLSQHVLRWVGLRSYSIYLWHWPVFAITRPQLDVSLDGLPLLVLRFALSAVLAELSFRWIERPIRDGALGRAWQVLRQARGWQAGLRWGLACVVSMALFVPLGIFVVSARPVAPPAEYTDETEAGAPLATPTQGVDALAPPVAAAGAPAMRVVTVTSTPAPTRAALPRLTVVTTSQAHVLPMAAGIGATPTVSAARTAPTANIMVTPTVAVSGVLGAGQRATAVGDSVMRGAAREIQQLLGNVDVDATVSRQAGAAIGVLRARRDAGTLGDIVIVHIGSNGYFTTRQFDEMMRVLTNVRQVLIMNVKVPRRWEGPNNVVIGDGVKRYANAVLVDWYAATAQRPELFSADGVHPVPDARRLYAELIAAQIKTP